MPGTIHDSLIPVPKELGWKWTMVIGILGHALRFATFSFFGNSEYQALIIFIQVIHGICYAFFFATLYIFVDEVFPKDIRTSAQGLFNLLILGVGLVIANFGFIYLKDYFTKGQPSCVDGPIDQIGGPSSVGVGPNSIRNLAERMVRARRRT